jgi:hypothetical protein
MINQFQVTYKLDPASEFGKYRGCRTFTVEVSVDGKEYLAGFDFTGDSTQAQFAAMLDDAKKTIEKMYANRDDKPL